MRIAKTSSEHFNLLHDHSVRIAVDIRHLTHPRLSGVGLYTLNVLRVLSRIAEPSDSFVLFASGAQATLRRLPPLPSRAMTLITRPLPNRLVFGMLKAGVRLESLLGTEVDGWWFPDANIARTRLPYALTVHDLAMRMFPNFFTIKDRLRHRIAQVPRLAENAQCVMAVSESTALDCTAHWGIPRERIVVTPLGVNAQYTPNVAPSDRNYQRGYGLSGPYLLFLATLEPRKNIESVLEAYDACRRSGVALPRLVIAGGAGWKDKGILAAKRAAVHERDMTFLGYVHEKHKPALYRGAATFVFPSYYEGFGLPVLEAMACGTPVITSFAGALPEVAKDAALFVDPYNVADLSLALTQLFREHHGAELRHMLTTRGVLRARDYSWEKTGETTLEALRSITQRQPLCL